MKLSLIFSMLVFLSGGVYAADPAGSAQKEPEAMKYMKPGEGHKPLADFVGSWKYTSQWWMAADAKPEKSEGTSVAKWILDGRFIQNEVMGTAMGQAFSGIAIMGYDSFKGVYQSVWIDNMATAMMTSTGSYDAKKKTFTENGSGSDPMSGLKDKAYRSETKFKNKNAFTMTMYSKTADGKEFKCMEMEYTRVKQ